MGHYINPPQESKEEFLKREGVYLPGPIWPKDETLALICLIDNGAFTAAGICYNHAEMEAFNNPSDKRPRKWFWVEANKLREVQT